MQRTHMSVFYSNLTLFPWYDVIMSIIWYNNEPPEFGPKMLSVIHSFITYIYTHTFSYNFHCSHHISQLGQMQKMVRRKKPPTHQKITEVLIHIGLILSHDLCVCWSLGGDLPWSIFFLSTNCSHRRFTWDLNRTASMIIINYQRSPRNTSPVQKGP